MRPGGWIHTEPVLLELTLTRWLQATHFEDQASVIPSVSASAALSVPSSHNGGANLWQFDHPDRSVQPFAALASSFSFAGPVSAMVETYVFANAGRIAPKDAGVTFVPVRLWGGGENRSAAAAVHA